MKLDKGIYLAFSMAAFLMLIAYFAGRAEAAGPDGLNEGAYSSFTAMTKRLDDPVENIIAQQLFAIRSRNAARAFSLTSTGLHDKYTDEEDYLQKIRFKARPIYDFKDYKFLDRHEVNGGMIQRVEMIDSDGKSNIVIFRLVEQKNNGKNTGQNNSGQSNQGSWLIDAYSVLNLGKGEAI